MSSGDPAAPSVRRELQRKAIHMATAVLPVAYAAGAPRWAMVGVTAGLTTLAVAVEVARRRWPAARDRFAALTGPLLRPHEAAGGVAGATWLFAAFCAVCAMTAPPVAIAAMWAVSAGDGAASVVGRAVGRVRWGSGKTLEGSLALALMTAAGAWGLAGWPLPVASGLGLAAA
ncbi:MAG: hypothetical protein MUF53_09975, partial [Gemmatimonadaceae bacterium]|nr:hypothetical protein [Gemmatimonadaceae bacterium]